MNLSNSRHPRRTNYRFRTPDHTPISFTDLRAGSQTFTTSTDFGDFLIWRKPLTSNPSDIGLPSYQLACVVDDALTHITEVVRGRDLLKSTARQILLQRALHYPTPAYFHCDLMRDSNGIRLAKRHDALALRTLRANGLSPADILALF
jgi:glutamyl-tRNA synthetase